MATIGMKIKELRKKQGMTQEALAAALNISTQAVSKWECGVSYPDILMMPVLANLFGVAIDALYDYDATHTDDKITEIIRESKQWFWSAPEKCEAFLTDALKQYPANIRLMTELLRLWEAHLRQDGYTDALGEKAIRMAETIIGKTDDLFAECTAKASLASIYLLRGSYAEAKALIDTLPTMYPYMLNDKMRVSAYQLHGEDRLGENGITGAVEWKIIEIQELIVACIQEGTGYYETKQYESAAHSFSQAAQVVELFMEGADVGEDNYLWSGMQTHHWAALIGKAGALKHLGKQGESDAALERAKYILTHAWDGFAEREDLYRAEFQNKLAEFGLQ